MMKKYLMKFGALAAALVLAAPAFGTGSEYYDHTTYPSQGSAGSSSAMRAELDLIEAGFGKLPTLTGNGLKIVGVNSGGTALEAVTTTGTGNAVRATAPTFVTPVLGVATATSINKVAITAPASSATLTLADGSTHATVGAYTSTFTFTGATSVTFPTSGTLLTTSGSVSNLLGGVAGAIPFQSGVSTTGFSAAGTAGQAVLSGGTGAPTFTTGTLSLGGNFTVSGASALTLTTTGSTGVTLPTTGTLATLAGAEVLTNKTIAYGSNTLTGVASSGANSNITSLTGLTSSLLTSGTSQATTSGTSKTFTGIPTWAKRITLSLSKVSTNGTDNLLINIGPIGGVEITGYEAVGATLPNASAISTGVSSSGFPITIASSANSISGTVVLTLVDASTNTWVCNGMVGSSANTIFTVNGSKSLAGVLERVQFSTSSGINTFDAGLINILYE